MGTLTAILLPNGSNPALMADCSALIHRIVAEKRGVRGRIIQAAFAMVLRQRPDFLDRALTRLLPLFCAALEPLFVGWQRTGETTFVDFLRTRPETVTQTLLQVTDQRAAQARPIFQRAYQRLRPHAEQEVSAALPHILTTLARYL